MNKSLCLAHLVGIYAAGPMAYTPAYTKPDGTKVNARSEGTFFMNDFFIDGQGVRQDRSHKIKLTFWNGNNSPAGKGIADTAAKYITTGKEISCHAQIHSYDGRVFDKNDNALGYADGSALTVPKISFTVEPSTLRLMDDAPKQLQNEYALYAQNQGALSFDARPLDWRTPNSAGEQAWAGIKAWRTAQVFQPGSQRYGYAKVMGVPAGCTAVSSHNTAPAPIQANAGTTTVVAGGGTVEQATVITGAQSNAGAGGVVTLPEPQLAAAGGGVQSL